MINVIDICGKALMFQYLIPPLYLDLENRNVRKMSKIVIMSCIFVTLIYIGFGIFGYYLYGNEVSSDVIVSLANGSETAIARITIVITLIGTYPMIINAGIIAIENKCFNPLVTNYNFQSIQWLRSVIISIMVFCVCVVSLFVTKLGLVSSLEGVLSIIIMTVPILVIWNLGFIPLTKQSMSYAEMKRISSRSNNILDMLNLENLINHSYGDVSEPLLQSKAKSDSIAIDSSDDTSAFIVIIGWKTKSILFIMLFCGIIICGFRVYQCFV